MKITEEANIEAEARGVEYLMWVRTEVSKVEGYLLHGAQLNLSSNFERLWNVLKGQTRLLDMDILIAHIVLTNCSLLNSSLNFDLNRHSLETKLPDLHTGPDWPVVWH